MWLKSHCEYFFGNCIITTLYKNIHLDAINRPFVGSTKRSPFEKVFGQKPNEFENVTVTFEDAVSEGHVEDVMEAIVT